MEARRAATEATKERWRGLSMSKVRAVGGFLGPDQKGVPVLVTCSSSSSSSSSSSRGGREGGKVSEGEVEGVVNVKGEGSRRLLGTGPEGSASAGDL